MAKLMKRNGTHQDFQRSKVEQSLRRSGASDDVIKKTLQSVVPTEGESTSAFRTRITTELKSQSPETARRYEDSRRPAAGRSETMAEGTAQGGPATLSVHGWKPDEAIGVQHGDKSQSVKVEESAHAGSRAAGLSPRMLTSPGAAEGTTVTNTRAGTQMLEEALARLNEASKESREEVRKLLDDKYTDLRSAFGGAAPASTNWFKRQGSEVGDKAKLAAKTVNRSVRMHPWYYVGGAVASGLVVGLLVGGRAARPASAQKQPRRPNGGSDRLRQSPRAGVADAGSDRFGRSDRTLDDLSA